VIQKVHITGLTQNEQASSFWLKTKAD